MVGLIVRAVAGVRGRRVRRPVRRSGEKGEHAGSQWPEVERAKETVGTRLVVLFTSIWPQ